VQKKTAVQQSLPVVLLRFLLSPSQRINKKYKTNGDVQDALQISLIQNEKYSCEKHQEYHYALE